MADGSWDVGWTLDGRTIRLDVTYSDRFTYVADTMTVPAPLAGLWADRERRSGRPELADAILAAQREWAATPEAQASAIIGQPVWGVNARLGECHGCGDMCADGERHYYALPGVGTQALCLTCGPEENYAELAEAEAVAERLHAMDVYTR
jgi:hypothetical protein